MKKINPLIWAALIGAISAVTVAVINNVWPMGLLEPARPKHVSKLAPRSSRPLSGPVDVSSYFHPSGWMGDGEQGTTYINLDTASRATYHSSPTAIKVTYQPGPRGWAGIFWQYPDSNWGDKPGRNLKGHSRFTFWAKGENGGEIVEFKAGGIADSSKAYQDSFEKSLRKVNLSSSWREYVIDISQEDLTNVIGAFAWIATKDDNPAGIAFYLDDIRLE